MKEKVFEYFEERFGISGKVFSGFRLYSDQKGRVILGPRTIPLDKAISIGMQIAHMNGSIKPSTNFLQMFGRHATKNIVEITKEQAQKYIKGEDIEFHVPPKSASEGYVLLKYLEFPLACGLLKGNKVRNVLPKPRRSQVKFL